MNKQLLAQVHENTLTYQVRFQGEEIEKVLIPFLESQDDFLNKISRLLKEIREKYSSQGLVIYWGREGSEVIYFEYIGGYHPLYKKEFVLSDIKTKFSNASEIFIQGGGVLGKGYFPLQLRVWWD